MLEDMVGAEAVIPSAFGTVTELQVRPFGIGPAADLALVPVSLLDLPLSLTAGRGLKLDGLLPVPMPCVASLTVQHIHQIAPEEDQEIQQSGNGQQRLKEPQSRQRPEDIHRKEDQVRDGQPFCFDGNDIEQKQLRVRVQGGKGQEHGHTHIVSPVGHPAPERDKTDQSRQSRQDSAGEVVEAEFRRSPLPFQHIADEVHKVESEDQLEGLIALRHKDECDKPPDLPSKNTAPIQGHEVKGRGTPEAQQEERDYIAEDDVLHQIWIET